MNDQLCGIDGCEAPSRARGLCGAHHQRLMKGVPIDSPIDRRPRGSLIERVMRKVDLEGDDGCWIYLGAKDAHGYGHIGVGGRSAGGIVAHRATFKHFVGPIPDGYQIDHLCRVPSCVNPDHLEAVPPAENNRRSGSPSAVNIQKTHCVHGHPFEGKNLRLRYRNDSVYRTCITCDVDRKRQWRDRRRGVENEVAA